MAKAFVPLRVIFILLMLTTGIGKLLDIPGFAAVIATYQFFIPESLLAPLGLSVALFELFLGVALIAGYQLRWCGVLLILMHLGYTVMAIITNLRGLDLQNCGCFGVFLARPMTWVTVGEDTVLTLLSAWFLYCVNRRSAHN